MRRGVVVCGGLSGGNSRRTVCLSQARDGNGKGEEKRGVSVVVSGMSDNKNG